MAKIYLSSTFEDLQEYRAAVYEALRQLRHDVIAMEDYPSADQIPVQKCLNDVASSDIYVGLFAWRYGYIPPEDNPDGKSITELEYREAVKRGKPCFIFLLDESAPWLRSMMDTATGDGESGQRIQALREEFALKKLVKFFRTPEELARFVSVSVSNWQAEQN